MVSEYQRLIDSWSAISPLLFQPRNEEDLDRLIEMADYIMDRTQGNDHHPLSGLLDIVGTLIAEYERRNIPEPQGTPAGCIKYLMEEHGLAPSDLPEIGNEEMVSEILSGKQQLDISQIRLLSKRFRVSPAIFVA